MSNLCGKLEERAHLHPDRVALSAMRGRRIDSLTFGELLDRVKGGAAFLASLGLRKGDHVIFVHPVAIPLYEALLACMSMGVVAVFVDVSAGRALFAHACERMKPKAIFFGGAAWMLRILIPALRRIPIPIRSQSLPVGGRRWRADLDHAEIVAVDDLHPALVTFTSGSTGEPKAVVRSHGFLLAQHRALASAMQHEEGQIDLVTLPIFTLGNLASGMTSVLADMDFRRPGEPDAARLARQCAFTRPQRCAASPAFFQSILDTAPEVLSRLKRIETGGAPVFPDLLERLRTVSNGKAHVAVVYGSTEAEPISHFEASQLTDAIHQRIRDGGGLPVGRAVKEIELMIIEDHSGVRLGPFDQNAWKTFCKGPMEKGEIVVTGSHVVQGYLDGKGDAEGKIRVGDTIWHRTGDAGYLDQEGDLWLLGRGAAADRRGNEAMYPFAVEAAFRSISGRRCAFIPQGDKRYLCVEGQMETEEKSAIMRGLAWAQIDRLVELDVLPMDTRHQAKIDYPRLHEQLKRILIEEA